MQIYCYADYQQLSRHAANIISAQVILKADSVLGLATGSTPTGIYRQLVDWYNKGDLNFSRVRSVNLDEYVGLAPEHPQSYHCFMRTQLFEHVNIRPENTLIPNGLAGDTEAECARYDAAIRALGGVDLQLLGMGHNGHIGFNEPGHAFELGTHVVRLSDSTRSANARFFGGNPDAVPEAAITMGIKNVMLARSILMVVSGKDKAEIVRRAFAGPVTPEVPASILQLHPSVTLMGDADAMELLAQTDVPISREM